MEDFRSIDQVGNIELITTSSEILIAFTGTYRNKVWGEKFGIIQDLLRTKIDFEIKIKIDFRKLLWIDPLPLLSLQLALAELKKPEVLIYLPRIGDNNGDSNRLLAFLSSEGFFNSFLGDGISFYSLSLDNTDYPSLLNPINDFSIFEKLIGELSYTECSLINSTIVDLNTVVDEFGSIDTWVGVLIQKSELLLRGKIESYIFSEVVNRLKRLLSETVSNVYEHAYQEKEPRYIGLYVRFRNGLANTRINIGSRNKLKRLFDLEHKSSPELTRYFIENVFNFIEIFVIDSGIGLAKNYDGENGDKWPFRTAWRKAIVKGARGKQSGNKKRTRFGGLYSISRNLGNNYICARDGKEWIGHSLPVRGYEITGESIPCKSEIKGLSLIFRLTWKIVSDEVDGWYSAKIKKYDKSFQKQIENHPLYEALCACDDIFSSRYKYSNDLRRNSFFVIDERFAFSKKQSNRIYYSDLNNLEYCIYLPSELMQKNQVIQHVDEKFAKIQSHSKTLIICDIIEYEANLFQLALEEAVFSKDFYKNFTRIILITKSFSTLSLKNFNNVFKKEIAYGKRFFKSEVIDFKPNENLKDFILWLKTHDSTLFWLLIKDKSDLGQVFFINATLSWEREDVKYKVNGYLDFSQIISDSDTRMMLENTAMRTFCFGKLRTQVQFENIDALTSRIASKINSITSGSNFPKTGVPKTTILLGSVLVSGLSLHNAKMQHASDYGVPIHFFLHSSIEKKDNQIFSQSLPHFFLWPKDWLDRNFDFINIEYSRVGQSHVIAPYGSKYFPIPRFRLYSKADDDFIEDFTELTEIKDYEFVSTYGARPSETYEDWQITGKPIIEFGHFHYEGYHDLLKIDFPLAINDSFNEGGKLSVFLLAEFIMALGINPLDLNGQIPWFLKYTQSEKTSISNEKLDASYKKFLRAIDSYIKENKNDECAIIVYPSHHNTEHLIEIIKDFIPQQFHSRIVPLIPVNKNRNSSSYLISPLILEKIKRLIASSKAQKGPSKAMLFDGVTIEGKTRKELKHLLFHAGATEVKTLCIVDRRRLPYSTTVPKKHRAYWRLDIPRLGKGDHCILCKSLEMTQRFKNNLIFSEDKFRIDEWTNAWGSQFPYSVPDSHGLTSKPLRKNISKRFSLYINKETGKVVFNDMVDITNSLGATIYASEVLAMTAKDDIALDLCKINEIDDLGKIEILAVTLLLFSKDLSKIVHGKMIESLFHLINNQVNVSNESALGVLSLWVQPRDMINVFIGSYENKDKTDLTIKNKDLTLLLASYANSPSIGYGKYKSLAQILKNQNSSSLNKIYYDFHHELYNDFGRIHNTPLQNFLSLFEFSEVDFKQIREAISSCDKLIDLLNNFPFWNANGLLTRENFNGTITSLNETRDRLLEFLVNTESEYTKFSKTSGEQIFNYSMFPNKLDSLKSDVLLLTKELEVLHSKFFINLGNQSETKFPLKDQLICLLDNHMKDLGDFRIEIIHFQKKVEVEYERWVLWDKIVDRAIFYLIHNVRHSTGFMDKEKNYYDSNNDNLHTQMFISLEYGSKNIKLILENFSPRNSNSIQQEIKEKKRPENLHLSEIGAKVNYTDVIFNENIYHLKTTIELQVV